jgi:hypothetical protein
MPDGLPEEVMRISIADASLRWGLVEYHPEVTSYHGPPAERNQLRGSPPISQDLAGKIG